MKPFEVALFKHFIEGKGMTTVFINSYRKRHHKTNPISIEEFLATVDVKEVCTHAFYFVINERWGHDYWMQMQKEWLEFLNANENNYSSDEWWKLQGMAQILRYNWDAAKHWKKESRYTAAIRLGIDLSLLNLDEKECTEHQTKLSEEYIREKGLEEFKKEQNSVKEYPTPEDFAVGDDDNDDNTSFVKNLLEDFVDVDVKARSTDKRRLKDDEISVNTRNKAGRITFNQTTSKDIKARGGYEYAALLRNKRGDVIIKLNDEKGVPIQDGSHSRDKSNVVIHSLAFVENLVAFTGIERDYEIVKIKEVAKTNDFVAYLVEK